MTERFGHVDNLGGLQANFKVTMHAEWPFCVESVSLKMFAVFIHVVACINTAFFFPIVIKNR